MTRRRRWLAIGLVAAGLLAAAAAGYAAWANRPGPPPPSLPAGWTDPPILRVANQKRQAVLAAPRSAAAWGELGMAFDAHDASAEAIACYRRAIALDPDDARWLFLLAEQLNWRSRVETDKEAALRLYRQAADARCPTPDHRNAARLSLADLLTELGRGDEAAPIYEEVHAADPADPWAAYRVGLALAERGETAKASRLLLGLARNPAARKKSAVAMAELTRRAGNAKEADGYDYAAGLLPPDSQWGNPFAAEVADLRRGRAVLMDTYVAQEQAADYRRAVDTATALADRYPSVETQLLLLRALVNLGEHAAAVAAADDLLRTDAGRRQTTAHAYLGLARIGLADKAEAAGRKAEADRLLTAAAADLAEAVRLKPDYSPGYYYRARALLRLGRTAEAEAAARGGVASRLEESEGYLVLADVLAAAGRKPEAVAAAEQAVKLAPPNDPRPKQALAALKK